jgi:hypothetical protein
MYDCDVCMSAGSVNQWGYCEICGEDFEDPGSLVRWHGITADSSTDNATTTLMNATVSELAGVAAGQDAA